MALRTAGAARARRDRVRVVGVHVLAQEPHRAPVNLDDEHVLVLVVAAVQQRAPGRGLGHHPVAFADQAADLDLRGARLAQPLADRLGEMWDYRPPATIDT